MESKMLEFIGQVGVGGIFLLLVLQMVFKFVKEHREKKNGADETGDAILLRRLDAMSEVMKETCNTAKATSRHTSDLLKMHEVKDADGVPIWYYRRSMEDAIDRLGITIDKQTTVMNEMSRRQERSTDVLERIVKTQEQLWDKMQQLSTDLTRTPPAPLPRVASRPHD